MTYRDLLVMIQKLALEQLDMNATVEVDGEYIPIRCVEIVNNSDVLDPGHPVLICSD